MKQSETFETITEHTLAEAELSHVQGGYPAGAGPHAPEGPTGRPLPSFGTLRIPPEKLESITGKRRPGETPPIIVLPTA